MKKFEYKTIKFAGDAPSLEDTLNNLGKNGWELVHIQDASGMFLMFFKREIEVMP